MNDYQARPDYQRIRDHTYILHKLRTENLSTPGDKIHLYYYCMYAIRREVRACP